MKRNRHFKPQVFSTEEKLQDEVQIVINKINDLYGNKFPKYTELITNFFKKISFYLPDIYRIDYTNEEIQFMSRATPGFKYTLWLEHERYDNKSKVYEEIDECTFSSLEIMHQEFIDTIKRHSVIHLHDQEGQFDKAIGIIKAIVKSPKVIFCKYFWFDGYIEDLLQETTFSDETIKQAETMYKYYFKCKQSSSAFMSEYNRGIKNLVNEICNEYADEIYKLGYGVVGKLHDTYNIDIRTRAKVYYGDKDRYDKFIRELALKIKRFCERYKDDYNSLMIANRATYEADFGFTKDIYINIFFDGRYFDNDTNQFNSKSYPLYFDGCISKLIYVKRKGE